MFSKVQRCFSEWCHIRQSWRSQGGNRRGRVSKSKRKYFSPKLQRTVVYSSRLVSLMTDIKKAVAHEMSTGVVPEKATCDSCFNALNIIQANYTVKHLVCCKFTSRQNAFSGIFYTVSMDI